MPEKKIGLIIKDPKLLLQVRDDILVPARFSIFNIEDEQAKLLIEEIDLDLVIFEVNELEGEDLNQVLKHVVSNPLIPILIIFKSGALSQQVEALRLGVADCLALPIQGPVLLEAISRSFSRWSRLKSRWAERSFNASDPIFPYQSDWQALLDSAADGIILLDEQDLLRYLNRSAKQIFNLELDALDWIDQPLIRIIDHIDLQTMVARIPQLGSQQDEVSLENGKVYNTHLSVNPGKGALIIMQDISRLKDLDRVKSDFVAAVSHDLRSPLTAILGYTELIDRVGPINDQQREFIRRIQFSTHNITNLINDLLDLGRIEAGFDTQKEVVSLTSIARYAVQGLRSRIEEKRQDVQLELEENPPNVFGNPIRLRQMAGNLVGNAVKYTPAEGRIWVRVLSGGGTLIFQVQDSGPGIPHQEQPYIFNKFYRGTNFPTDTPGTGLGLAIVKSIAENHQGRVWVESSPGKGSTFTVVLPPAEQT
jgi:signal transduction histidine kinase